MVTWVLTPFCPQTPRSRNLSAGSGGGDPPRVIACKGGKPMRRPTSIASPKGKLGVLMPGMGAVSTTFMAGVELVRTGCALPIGSVTQLATIRLGKRTERRSPLIREFVPLEKLDNLVFGGWDIFPDTAYEEIGRAHV